MREAKTKALGAIRNLNTLGIALDVTVWTENWRSRRVEERDKRKCAEVLTSERRTEAVELRDEQVEPTP